MNYLNVKIEHSFNTEPTENKFATKVLSENYKITAGDGDILFDLTITKLNSRSYLKHDIECIFNKVLDSIKPYEKKSVTVNVCAKDLINNMNVVNNLEGAEKVRQTVVNALASAVNDLQTPEVEISDLKKEFDIWFAKISAKIQSVYDKQNNK